MQEGGGRFWAEASIVVGRANYHGEAGPRGRWGMGRRVWAAAIVIVGRADHHGEEAPEGHDGVVGDGAGSM